MQSYREVINQGKETLRDAGFSEAEVRSFLREYGRNIKSGATPKYIQDRIDESVNARLTRRNCINERLLDPETIMAGSIFLGLGVGLVTIIGTGIASLAGADSSYTERGIVLGAVLTAGIPFCVSMYGCVGGFNQE